MSSVEIKVPDIGDFDVVDVIDVIVQLGRDANGKRGIAAIAESKSLV